MYSDNIQVVSTRSLRSVISYSDDIRPIIDVSYVYLVI